LIVADIDILDEGGCSQEKHKGLSGNPFCGSYMGGDMANRRTQKCEVEYSLEFV
jgi:hypothetical protein